MLNRAFASPVRVLFLDDATAEDYAT